MGVLYSGSCFWFPWVRGTKIHKKFADYVRKQSSKYKAEISYIAGRVVPYGTKGSMRIDALYGDVNYPVLAVELKTGLGYLSTGEAKFILSNLPDNTPLYKLTD